MNRALELPESVYAALEEAARLNGTTAVDWIATHLPQARTGEAAKPLSRDDWLDHDFLTTYAVEGDEAPDLESVRKAMAKIPGRLADDIRAERDER